jgi:hypothetical protein
VAFREFFVAPGVKVLKIGAIDDWRQNSKNNFKNLTLGATKNSLNATKRNIKKAFLEPKLLNFKRCSCVPT